MTLILEPLTAVLFSREQMTMIIDTMARNNEHFRRQIDYYTVVLDDGSNYDEIDAVFDIEDHCLDDKRKNRELLRCARFALIAIGYYIPDLKKNGGEESAFFIDKIGFKVNTLVKQFLET